MFTVGLTVAFVLAAYGVLGIFAVILGHVMASLLRLRWSGRSAAADAALATLVALALVVAMGVLYPDASYGVVWIVVLSFLSVVLRYWNRFIAGRRATRPAV